MKLEDVMTTQEAGERWNVPADSIKQCCLKRYANKQFTEDEARKSGRNWLVTRQGMERLYGKEIKPVRGTYFIGYARYWDVTKTMLTNMFTQNDKLLDYSKPITGMLFFIPSLDTLDAIAAGEL